MHHICDFDNIDNTSNSKSDLLCMCMALDISLRKKIVVKPTYTRLQSMMPIPHAHENKYERPC